MLTSRWFWIRSSGVMVACVVVAMPALAVAQVKASDVECKATELQSECHARLQCKPDEELEDCQKRLLACKSGETLKQCEQRVAAQHKGKGRDEGDRNEGDRNEGDRNEGDRERDRDRDRDRGRDDTDRGDRDRGDRGDRDRGDRGEADHRGRGRRESRGERGRRGGGGGGGGGGFEANKTFGLGLELGEPSGVSGKVFVTRRAAIDFGVGAMYGYYYYGDGLNLYGDFLYHPVSLVHANAFELPFYIGVGLRFWSFQYCYQGPCDYRGSTVGIRVPIGVAFDFNNAPLDIFLQVVPVFDFVDSTYYARFGDRNHVGVDASVGVRFWFR